MFMGIPISAPVEKGFIPTSILEETGIFGALAFYAFIISLAAEAMRRKDPGWAGLFFGCLYINVGEAVIFSVGGIGLFYWLLIGIAIAGHGKEESSPADKPSASTQVITKPTMIIIPKSRKRP